MRVADDKLVNQLHSHPNLVRNICIIAHVDHGKTTLADSLVASNGIISSRMVGKLRYMDSRKDEQLRGITMKSSAISLVHSFRQTQYLVNLIDSPGHVDFSTEVSTAVRLCDGAILVVDVVEGVCPQTKVALQQAWQENIKPVLVLNKIDRLILELKLTPLDAYIRITQVLEQVNAVTGELFTTDVLARSEQISVAAKETESVTDASTAQKDIHDWSAGLEEADDEHLYFSPESGNVAFASAYDGWAFQVKDFARMYAAKLGINETVLNKTLWGDYYLHAKSKRILKGAQAKAKKPMFVQFVLENLWALYDVIAVRRDKDKLEKILQSLNIKVMARDLRTTDCKVQLQAVCSGWLPLASCVLDMVCERLPPPVPLSEENAERLMCSHNERFDTLPAETQSLRKAFINCSSSPEAPTIVFISKMFAVERQLLPENKAKPLNAEELAQRREAALQRHASRLAGEEVPVEGSAEAKEVMEHVEKLEDPDEEAFIAFARVFSGTLRVGQELFVLGPKHDPRLTVGKLKPEDVDSTLTLRDLKSNQHVTRVRIEQLYLLMGRDLLPLQHVPAGNVIGIGGLQDHVLKTATLSDTLACPSFADINQVVTPILRVAVETAHPTDMPALVRGLKLLNQADPAVEVRVQETGEHVILTVGEVHLQRCLEDLKERYAKVEINVSEPIVPFRETIVPPPMVDMVNEAIEELSSVQTKENEVNETITLMTPNKQCRIVMRAAPLPASVVTILEDNSQLIRALEFQSSDLPSDFASLHVKEEKDFYNTSDSGLHSLTDRTKQAIAKFKTALTEAFEEAGASWNGAVDKIWCFGPRRCGPNILFNHTSTYQRCVWHAIATSNDNAYNAYDSSFVNGFQLATLAGPLCEEPMMGVAFVLEEWEIVSDPQLTSVSFGPLSGQILSTVKDGCRKAFQAQPQRLMMAMYSCTIQVNSEVLGKMYAVLGRRHGRVLHGDMTQGSATFSVTAVLPVVESFSFAPEMRKQTSGLASPQLVFSHWEVLEVDPFWVPRTEEEYLHFGEKADSENRARRYMDAVRRRKGLAVEEKVVEFAEKQRTLGKNK